MKNCPNCSEELDDDMLEEGVCSHCGQPFEEWELVGEGEEPAEEEPEEDEGSDDPRRKKK